MTGRSEEARRFSPDEPLAHAGPIAPAADSNPFATRFVKPGALVFEFPPGESARQLVPRLAAQGAGRVSSPKPAPITAMICRASSFSAGIRLSFASSINQYSMSKASRCGRGFIGPRRRGH